MDKLNSANLVVLAEQEPGTVSFHNYEALKAKLESGLAYYNSFEYSVENIDMAMTNRDELKKVKKEHFNILFNNHLVLWWPLFHLIFLVIYLLIKYLLHF